jgi:preprotein translocase subunit YajC
VSGLLIIIILFGVVWLLFIMPARRRRGQHASMQDSVVVGSDVITAGGIHGTVTEADEDTVRVEIAPSVVVTLDRRAIAAVATEVEVEVDPEDVAEEDSDAEAGAEPEEAPASETPAEPR